MVKLVEMFSAIGAPKEDNQDIDWLDDLKFFIDHNHDLQVNKIIPTVHKHREHAEKPDAYKLYMKPLMDCVNEYCETFDVEDKEECFPVGKIEELARNIASVQENYIKNNHYK
jgi:hypothetical protein